MNQTLFEQTGSLRVGTVHSVAPDEINVVLNIEAPESVALNTGVPRPFPRVNGYLLIPVDEAFLVGQVEWLTVDRSPFPKQQGRQRDFGLVDLPHPFRKLQLNPLGTLRVKRTTGKYKFSRGADALPSVGTTVVLPTEDQLLAIIESGEHRRVNIGTSPLAGNAEIAIDPNRLFGRHLAVLGNTGSGKSCSVAGLIRWSIEAVRNKWEESAQRREEVAQKREEIAQKLEEESQTPEKVKQARAKAARARERATRARAKAQKPNARFIVLDPNGEYSRAFRDNTIQIFKVDPTRGDTALPLKMPLQLWSDLEWYAFTRASPGVQQPALAHALRFARKSQEGVARKPLLDGLEEAKKELYNDNRFNHSHVDTLVARVDALLTAMEPIISGTDDKDSGQHPNNKMSKWLQRYTDNDKSEGICISVIDLSSVPSEVVHVVTAVIARMVFQAQQRYMKNHERPLPTVLVMEEAHTFVKRYAEDIDNQDAAGICCQSFEKIAREGRKFGLGLVVSSQRPSELSPTVLSQCNTFLLHRLTNDKDQDLVRRLVPDTLRGLLRELPSLPSQSAFLLGWASEFPVLVKMNNLPAEHRPHSDDPDFWGVWTGKHGEDNQVGDNPPPPPETPQREPANKLEPKEEGFGDMEDIPF